MAKKENINKFGVEFSSLKYDIVHLKERIKGIIWKFYTRQDIFPHPKDKELLIKFLRFLKPTVSIKDEGLLPVYRPSGRARAPYKSSCIFASLSRLFLDWMTFLEQDLEGTRDLITTLSKQCDYIDGIIQGDISEYIVVGSVSKGYTLAKKEKKE